MKYEEKEEEGLWIIRIHKNTWYEFQWW